MTKKQEEAIEYFKNKLKDIKPKYIETFVGGKKYRSEVIPLKMRFDEEEAEKMKIILNMIKEKDAEIEKKDKIIDLMLDDLNVNGYPKEELYNSYKNRVDSIF